MPVRRLPGSPNLQHLKAQANDLRRDHAARPMMAAQRLREFHPRFHALADDAILRLLLHKAMRCSRLRANMAIRVGLD